VRTYLAVVILVAAALAQTAGAPSTQRRYAISGTVVDALHGGGLHDIEVSIWTPESDTPMRAVVSGDDGHFEFRNLPRGKYGLSAHGHGYLNQAYQEHGNYSTAIVTGEGWQSEGLIFPLKPEASLSGVITDEFNEPAPRVQVLLFVTDMPEAEQGIFPRGEVSTDDIGHYRFSHLPEGKYYVVAKGRPWYAKTGRYGAIRESAGTTYFSSADAESGTVAAGLNVAYPTTYYPNVTDPEQATPITLKPGDRAEADFQLFAVPALRLTFRSASNSGSATVAPFLQERIFGQSRSAGWPGADSAGVAEFVALPPGRYTLRFAGEQDSQFREMSVDLTSDMDIAPGRGTEALASVTGTVQFEDGSPSPDGFVRLSNSRLGEGFGALVSNKGEFKVDNGVRPGQYNLFVLNSNSYVVKSVSAAGARMIGQQVEIPRGGSVRLSIVVTKGLGRIEGTALLDSTPASQAAIFLVPEDPAHNLPLFRRDQSDSDGTFTLRQVVPGNYSLIAVAEGWDLEWTNPAVLKSFLEKGLKVRVEADRKYQLKVGVQQRQVATASK